MATLSLTWKDFNLNEDGFNIYRSETPMDVNNMPAPIATVGPNVGSYDDTTGVVGTGYYYRVGAVRGTEEKISPEVFRVFDNTVNINDVFNDGSAVATYQFDGDATDLGGLYDLSQPAFYNNGLFGDAAGFTTTGSENIYVDGNQIQSFSAWVQFNNDAIGSLNKIIGVDGFEFGFDFRSQVDNRDFFIIIGDNYYYSTQYDLSPGVWYHVVIDKSKNVWVNSIGGVITSVTNSGGQAVIGGINVGGYIESELVTNTNFSGLIDQVRIFNRELTQEEVDFLYQEGAGLL